MLNLLTNIFKKRLALRSPERRENIIRQPAAELSEANEALRRNEERLRLALAAGRMVCWDWEISTDRVILSHGWEALHGIPPGSFPGTFEAYQSDIHPEDRESVLRSIRAAVEQTAEHHAEYRLVWPDGSVHWIEARGRVLRDPSGRPGRMIGICADIQERKHTEQSLRFLADASRSLAALVDYQSTMQTIAGSAVPGFADGCAVHLAGEDGELLQVAAAHVDPTKAELVEEFGNRVPLDPQRQIGPAHVFRTGRCEMVEQISEALLAAAAQDENHLRVLRQLHPTSYLCVPLALRGGILGTLTFVISQSQRRYTSADLAVAEDLGHRAAVAIENARLYAKVKEADRRKDELLAMLAHELRNPLAPIRSGLDLLSLKGLNGTVTVMQEQLRHLVRLVDDLLDVSRIMRGRIQVHKQPVRLDEIVERSLEAARPLIEAQHHEITVSLPSSAIWLDADPVRMAQVVTNLLSNAAKYTPQAGRIGLMARREGERLIVSVRDSGIGIDRALLPRVFELFAQGDRTLDRSQGGLGIGLTLVKNLVEMHGGEVEAHSEGIGKGSEFVVRLPIPVNPVKHETQDFPSPTNSPRRVLIVEDNVAAAKMLAVVLEEMGNHQVQVAYDGETGLKLAKMFRPDVVLLDIGLPGIDGYEVARRLREEPEGSRPLVAAVTGYGQEEDRRRSQEAGFDEHLLKPVALDVMQRLFHHPKLLRETTVQGL